MGWRNFFSSCAVVSVFGSGGKYVLVLHTYVLRVQYSCGAVLVFWFWWENTCCVLAGGTFFPVVVLCQILVLAGNSIWFYILMYLEYNTVVVLVSFLVLMGNSFWCYVLT
jgi:hypothetical protein